MNLNKTTIKIQNNYLYKYHFKKLFIFYKYFIFIQISILKNFIQQNIYIYNI